MAFKKIIFAIAIMQLFFIVVYGQKLPAIQQADLRAPVNIKIDGKATEWGTPFQAYNPACRMFYTLSNDKDNLYLVARMEDIYGSDKVIKTGITFTVNDKGAKSKVKNITVTYPTLKGSPEKMKLEDMAYYAGTTKNDNRKRDSLRLIVNKMIGGLFKQIQVSGIKEVNDTSIPIYNSQNIQTAMRFDEDMKCVYELAIPLKYLGDAVDATGKIKYSIKITGTAEGKGVLINVAKLSELLPSKTMNDSLYGAYSTDFSGEYTFAK